jgi:hypothetical protein
MHGGEGGGGECVDDGDERAPKDDVIMTVTARSIIIITAWLSGTQSSHGEEEGAAALLSSSIAITISEMLRKRTPARSHKLGLTLCVLQIAASCLQHCYRTSVGTATACRHVRTRRKRQRGLGKERS